MYHLFDTMSTSFRCSLIYIPWYTEGTPILFSIDAISIFCYFYNAFIFIHNHLHVSFSSTFSDHTWCTTTPLYFPSFLFTNSPSIPFRLKIPFPFITLGIALPSLLKYDPLRPLRADRMLSSSTHGAYQYP